MGRIVSARVYCFIGGHSSGPSRRRTNKHKPCARFTLQFAQHFSPSFVFRSVPLFCILATLGSRGHGEEMDGLRCWVTPQGGASGKGAHMAEDFSAQRPSWGFGSVITKVGRRRS